jgi:hypothetical protein
MKNAIIKGKKFDCSLLPYLQKLQLTDQQRNMENSMTVFLLYNYYNLFNNSNLQKFGRVPEDIVFLTATDARFFPAVIDLIDSIQMVFKNRHKKIIVYDLGGISENSNMVNFIL